MFLSAIGGPVRSKLPVNSGRSLESSHLFPSSHCAASPLGVEFPTPWPLSLRVSVFQETNLFVAANRRKTAEHAGMSDFGTLDRHVSTEVRIRGLLSLFETQRHGESQSAM